MKSCFTEIYPKLIFLDLCFDQLFRETYKTVTVFNFGSIIRLPSILLIIIVLVFSLHSVFCLSADVSNHILYMKYNWFGQG